MCFANCHFAGKLTCAVNRQRARGILLAPWLLSGPIEHVVGGKVNERDAARGSPRCNLPRCFCVHPVGNLSLILRAINRCIRCRSATTCETALWPAGRFAGLRGKSQGSDREGIIDADPVAACVRAIMAERSSWTGAAGPKIPARSLASWVQTFLRVLGFEITFSREGRAGNRIIRIRKMLEIPLAPSVASATTLHRDRPVTSSSLQAPTILMVLTQMPALASPDRCAGCGPTGGPTPPPICHLPVCSLRRFRQLRRA
jgi:hypothetical protein